jgi:cation/acetate symporter
MAVAFIGIWLFSVTDKSQNAADEHAKFLPQFVRSQTGLGASSAAAH